ncbi:aspartate--tRNA ligase, cytoplasmic-like [Macrosteles quadrilineatus]|uniref:aspartate--tRNA ligase, cytoplasmic-like n=1 Tax=Macrosteles quadrilineatus TaxID=74068 RepID=UPI0023E18A9A|nr:aspartate--tRNA ligase, cytoplasmic-like [Macrosteles quadrilineatus]
MSTKAVILLMCFNSIKSSHQDKDHKYSPKVTLLEPNGFSVTIEGLRHDYQERQKRQIQSAINLNEVSEGKFGSNNNTKNIYNKPFTQVKEINKLMGNQTVLIRGRLHQSRARGKQCFVILRQQDRTIQCFLRADEVSISRDMVKFVSCINRESIIDIVGQVQVTSSEIRSCTEKFIEILIKEVWVINEADILPIQVIDCMNPDIKEEIGKPRKEGLIHVSLDKKLDYRVLDLRTPTNQAIFRVVSGVSQTFREVLSKKGFIEIHTPKIISAASEGGADVFSVSYFKTSAYLAQSPQLYKQMAIAADFNKVFTVGAVFRAEQSDTARHLTEFVGLDFEMAFKYHYSEVLDVLEDTFIEMFEILQKKYKHEIKVIGERYNSSPLIFVKPSPRLNYSEGISMLKNAGDNIEEGDDLSGKQEKLLGALVKKKYKTDFFILDKFPLSIRPFYIMADPEIPRLSNSYDVFIRGEEVMSGGQRIHDVNNLKESALRHGVDLEKIKAYVEAFQYGCPPHAGGGIGLERTVALYLGLDNVRRASMFPRDPKRLTP